MAGRMMQLGLYQFSIDNAAYQRLFRSTEYRWAAIERIGKQDALQFTGLGGDTITLQGGLGQVDKMRGAASLGLPLPLIAGTGKVLGIWVIERVSEGQRTFADRGAPLRQDFTINVRRYDGGLRSLLPF